MRSRDGQDRRSPSRRSASSAQPDHHRARGREGSRPPRRLIGKTAQLRVLRPREGPRGSVDHSGQACRLARTLYPLLKGVQDELDKGGHRAPGSLDGKKRDWQGPSRRERSFSTSCRMERRRPAARSSACRQPHHHDLRADRQSLSPGIGAPAPGTTTTTCSATSRTIPRTRAGDDRRGPPAARHAEPTSARPASRSSRSSSRERAGTSSTQSLVSWRIEGRSRRASWPARSLSSSTSRSCSTARFVRARHRLQAEPGRHRRERGADHGPASGGEAKDLALVLQTGALPSSSSRSTAPTSRRRSARTRSARPSSRSSAAWRPSRSSCSSSTGSSGSSRSRPGDLRSLPLRGDPPVQRDADAARVRRPDPHDRRRRGREHRHLRAHQGRGAARQIGPAAIAAGYRKGFRTIVDANVVTMITASSSSRWPPQA